MRAEPALQVVKFAGPAVEAVLRRRREGAGFVLLHGRASKTATAAGVLCIRAPDKLGEQRGILCIQCRNGKIHPKQFIKFGWEIKLLKLNGEESGAFRIERLVFSDFPLHPLRFERGL